MQYLEILSSEDDDDDSANHESEDFATALLKDAEKRKMPRLEQHSSR